MRRDVALRTSQGVGLGEFKERYGIDVIADYAPVVAQFEQTGFCGSGSEFNPIKLNMV